MVVVMVAVMGGAVMHVHGGAVVMGGVMHVHSGAVVVTVVAVVVAVVTVVAVMSVMALGMADGMLTVRGRLKRDGSADIAMRGGADSGAVKLATLLKTERA